MSKTHPIQAAINSIKRNKYTVEDWPHYKTIPKMDDVKEYKAAVDKQHKMAWSWYNRHFTPIETTAHGLAVQVWNGNAFTPIYKDNWRRKVNFLVAHHIAFDFDTGDGRSSLDNIAQDWVYQEYGAFLYSTPSSTAEHPKSRMVFVFDKPITDIDRYELLYKAMLNLRFPHADQSVKDAARLFFGSYRCEVRGNWQLLTGDGQDDLIDAYNQALAHEAASRPVVATMTIPPERANGRFGKILAKLLDNIRNAPAGQRHRLVVSNCFAVGGYVTGGYISKGEAEAAVINAVAGMHPDADKIDLERTAVESLGAGMAEPLVIEQQLVNLGDLI
jgi:hypothetical protein